MGDSDNDVIDSAAAVSDAVRETAARLGLQQQAPKASTLRPTAKGAFPMRFPRVSVGFLDLL